MSNLSFDKTDRHILDHLQHDAKISNVALAEMVHLSPAPCLRRVKDLEQKGLSGTIRHCSIRKNLAGR